MRTNYSPGTLSWLSGVSPNRGCSPIVVGHDWHSNISSVEEPCYDSIIFRPRNCYPGRSIIITLPHLILWCGWGTHGLILAPVLLKPRWPRRLRVKSSAQKNVSRCCSSATAAIISLLKPRGTGSRSTCVVMCGGRGASGSSWLFYSNAGSRV